MLVINFAAYAPDLHPFDASYSDAIVNVLPTANGYAPFPQLVAYSNAVGTYPVVGYFAARTTDGTFTSFCATSGKLYKFNATSRGWDDVSRTASAYTGTSGFWCFSQYGNKLIACNLNDAPQVFDITTSTNFEDLAGSPPAADGVAIVGDFVFLYGLSGDFGKVHWSGLDDPEFWTPYDNSCDFQIFPDGGRVNFVAPISGGAYVLQERCIRALTFAPASSAIFTSTKLSSDRGCVSQQCVTQIGDTVFFLSNDGFYSISGGVVSPIGAEKVDRTFFDNVDHNAIADTIAANDPFNKVVYWAGKTSYTSDTYDYILGYDWQLGRWFKVEATIEFMASMQTPGYSIDDIPSLGYTLDTLPWSLDSRILKGGRPAMAAFDTAHKLALFEGDAMEATLETADIALTSGARSCIREFRPVTDASGAYGRIATRARHQDARTWKSESAIAASGRCYTRADGLLHRFRLRIPAGESWTTAIGIGDIIKRQAGRK